SQRLTPRTDKCAAISWRALSLAVPKPGFRGKPASSSRASGKCARSSRGSGLEQFPLIAPKRGSRGSKCQLFNAGFAEFPVARERAGYDSLHPPRWNPTLSVRLPAVRRVGDSREFKYDARPL